jgi:hypothetical protein
MSITTNQQTSQYLTIPEIARNLRVKPSAVYLYIAKGRLHVRRFGGQK